MFALINSTATKIQKPGVFTVFEFWVWQGCRIGGGGVRWLASYFPAGHATPELDSYFPEHPSPKSATGLWGGREIRYFFLAGRRPAAGRKYPRKAGRRPGIPQKERGAEGAAEKRNRFPPLDFQEEAGFFLGVAGRPVGRLAGLA
jgi:hypothetical protein